MPSLSDYQWQSIYESRPNSKTSYLINEFYVPALERCHQYDRIAGYFSSSALAVAAQGIEALVENDGEMRLIVGTELYETDRPVLEALSDELQDTLEDLDDEQLDAQLQLLAYLLRENRLQIKVASPREGSWDIFHPKVGIFHDEDGNALSFEGSVNETVGGWERNYERFKVHRSWNDSQSAYVDGDIDTFETLWADEHPFVEVFDLPEAIERELIDWKAPDTREAVETAVKIAQGNAPPTERDKANIIADGTLAPGGLALAEEGSTIEPWPHQRVVSDTLVNTYPNSFLLCDEVGLGKTIEAGLTISRLGLTNEVNTALLLVPASLTIQWQEELWEKFNINAYRYDRGSNYSYAFIDAFDREHEPPAKEEINVEPVQQSQAWIDSPIWRFLHTQQDATSGMPTVVILSWHTARLTDRWDQVAPRDNGETRTREEVPASCRGRHTDYREGVWDAVLVDEAHNAREGSNFYTLLDRLREHTQAYYLLTATPMQLNTDELYDLMTLLDLPDEWDNEDSFVEFFQTRKALETALNSVLSGNPDSDEESWSAQATLDEQRYQDRLPTASTLSDQVLDAVATELELDDENGRNIAKQRVLRACDLASAYGESYDGYLDRFEEAIGKHDVDPYDAREDEKLKYLLYPESKAEEEWLMYSRSDQRDALAELSEAGWRVVRDVLRESTPVDALIHRNTRDTLRKYRKAGILDQRVPNRNPESREIELTDEARQVYNRIQDYTREFYKLAQQSDDAETRAIGFVMSTYRQRLTSSIYAISQSLQNRLETLRTQKALVEGKQRAEEQDYGDTKQMVFETVARQGLDDADALDDLESNLEDEDLSELLPTATEEGLNLITREINELESFVSDLKEIESDPKINQLLSDIDELERAGHNRVIIFTQYADTMDFIRDRLTAIHGETVASYSGRGGEAYDADSNAWVRVGKEHVKQEFAADDGTIEILVCTDSASEGLNLQECGALINYELPWNPMRVEQRIGRIDRIGQEYKDIKILNYRYTDTIETEIYDRADSRINLFESVVGEMQPILASVNEQIRSAALEADDDQQAVEQADAEFQKQIEEQESGDQVDVGESLDTVDEVLAQDVIDEAKLDAWNTYRHPDVSSVGSETYEYTSPFVTDGLEHVFVGNETLNDAGITFTQITEVADENDVEGFPYADRAYRLDTGERINLIDMAEEGTIANRFAPSDDATVVTFDSECADEFPSVHYLAPGNPLLEQLVEIIVAESDEVERLSQITRNREETESLPIIRGWTRNGALGCVTPDGSVNFNHSEGVLSEWRDSFVENRR
jgi:SNF2 family DNA or RNA helicase